jgi:small subunit ribosomal protein S15
MLTKTLKTRIVNEHQRHKTDTGSAEVQVGVLSRQIEELTKHLKKHAKDNHSRRGLLKMVSQRRKLLAYLSAKQPKIYEKIIKKLGLKK